MKLLLRMTKHELVVQRIFLYDVSLQAISLSIFILPFHFLDMILN